MADEREGRQRLEAFLRSEGLDSFEREALGELFEKLCNTHFEQRAVSPEGIAVRNDLINRLSEEAKEVIKIIFNVPSELVEYVWGCKEKQVVKLTCNDIRQYLRYYGWKHLVIESAFREIKHFLRKI